MNVDDSVRMALSEVTRPASVGSVSEVTAELGSLAGTDASGGSSISSPSSYRSTLSPCFKCEYDVKLNRYVVRDPVVIYGQNSPIEPTDPGGLRKNKTYVCAVTRKANNEVEAEIVEEDKVPDEALVSVPICKIDDSRGFDVVTQYHVGAIVISSAGEKGKAAFDLEVTASDAGSKTGKIVRCNFVFDGENESLSDFSVSGSGSVYLVAKQPAPSGGMGDLPWTFEISESKGAAEKGGRVVNYKLYDLSDFAVTCDYRTTFMELKSPHHVSKFTVSKYEEPQTSVVIEACLDTEAKVTASDGTASATLKASNEKAETEVSDGSHSARMEADGTTAKLTLSGSKTVTVDPNDLTQGSEAKFHKLTVKHADGSADDVYDVIADKDITINESAGDERLTGVDLELSEGTKLRLKLTFTDKDGNEREEYSTGITLKQVDVVSDVSWSSPTLSKSGKKLTVIGEESSGDGNVFTAVAHSSNS